MEIDEFKEDAYIAPKTYPYEYAQFTALKMRESDLETELGRAPAAEKKLIESKLEYIRAKLKRCAAVKTRFALTSGIGESTSNQAGRR